MATINGTRLADEEFGTRKADIMRGFAGDDELRAGAGDDTVYGGLGDDLLGGDQGRDTLYGGLGDDWLYDQTSPREIDRLYGGLGNDLLEGSSGDLLFGGPDSDRVGGFGSVATGGSGRDTFDFDTLTPDDPPFGFSFGEARITDFEQGRDTIVLNLPTLGPEASFVLLDTNDDGRLTGADAAVSVRGGDLVIDVERALPNVDWASGADHTLRVDDVRMLVESDFFQG